MHLVSQCGQDMGIGPIMGAAHLRQEIRHQVIQTVHGRGGRRVEHLSEGWREFRADIYHLQKDLISGAQEAEVWVKAVQDICTETEQQAGRNGSELHGSAPTISQCCPNRHDA
jgi:hypothetical protein